jgi:hypothetical protein
VTLNNDPIGIIRTGEGERNVMTEKVIVRFAGNGSGVSELSWGQAEIWSVMRSKGNSLPMGGPRPLPPGQTVADVAAGLSFIMSRHQSLRTTLRERPGSMPLQVVHASGEITLDVVDAGDDDPGELAAAVAAGYKAEPFDLEREWPLRMAVITQRGTATHIAEMVCHIAVDAFGIAALQEDFDQRAERTGPVTAMQPMAQAERQQGPSGRRAHDASMRYFERQAAAAPDRQFGASADPRQPRAWQLTLDSPAGQRATGMLAARLGLSTSPVLLAAFAIALSALTGNDRVALHLVVSNRFRPGFAGSVSPLMQSCPGVIEVADASFEEVARRAWQSSLGAYKHAYYDPVGIGEVYRRLVAERGADFDWNVVFNDRRVLNREPDVAVPGADDRPGAILDDLARSTLTWGEPSDLPEEKVFLSICDAPGTLCCELRSDTHFVSPADMERLLKGIESTLIDAAIAAMSSSVQ